MEKRPIRSILRARCPANDKEHPAHDPMDCEPCDHGPSGIFGHRVPYKRPQKARKKAAMIRVKRGGEQNGPRVHRVPLLIRAPGTEYIDFDRVEKR